MRTTVIDIIMIIIIVVVIIIVIIIIAIVIVMVIVISMIISIIIIISISSIIGVILMSITITTIIIITVISINITITIAGHTARAAERHKWQRYTPAVVPFVVETEGRLGPEAQSFISATAAAAARRQGTLTTAGDGRLGSDYARQLANAVSCALTSRIADLFVACGQLSAGAVELGARRIQGRDG